MDQNVYHIKEFAEKAAVSVRTLRYYDKKGLLVPSLIDTSGYKLYTDEDFTQLQSILTFKFLGFSLNEIQEILSGNPEELHWRLEQQRAMLMGKRFQIEQIIEAIKQVEKTIQTDTVDIHSVVNLIRVTQMNLKPEWVNQYLSHNDRLMMREIAKESYSNDALRKLAARGWTEQDHQQHLTKYQYFRRTLTKLVQEDISPESKQAQELVEFLQDMNKRFSQDDPSIREGMKKSWERFNSLPKNKQPKTYAIPEKERDFIKAATKIFHSSKGRSEGEKSKIYECE